MSKTNPASTKYSYQQISQEKSKPSNSGDGPQSKPIDLHIQFPNYTYKSSVPCQRTLPESASRRFIQFLEIMLRNFLLKGNSSEFFQQETGCLLAVCQKISQ